MNYPVCGQVLLKLAEIYRGVPLCLKCGKCSVLQCDQMAPRIVEEIVGGVDPDFICQKLTLCQKGKLI